MPTPSPPHAMPDRPGVAIVLLNFNGWRDTLACIESLFASSTGFRQIVVADNASRDGSLDALAAGMEDIASRHAARWADWHAGAPLTMARCSRHEVEAGHGRDVGLVLLDNGANLGFAGGNNPALRLALRTPGTAWFWLLNNDTEVRPDTLGALLAACAQRPDVDLWGATVLYHQHPEQVQALGGGAMRRLTAETWHLHAFEPTALDRFRQPACVAEVERHMDYVLGASMFASRAWLERVGLLDDRYFLYCEELDWARRGRQQGLRLGYAPDAVVLHKEGASIGTDPSGGSVLSVFHLLRSRLIFTRLHLGPLLLTVLARALWESLKFLLKRRPAAAGAALRGTLAGLRADLPDRRPAPAANRST